MPGQTEVVVRIQPPLQGSRQAFEALDRSHVLAVMKTMDQVSKEYIKQTTGIIA